MAIGEEIVLRTDHVLTQDSTDALADLEFEAMGVPRINKLSLGFVNHNIFQNDFSKVDDHRYLQGTQQNMPRRKTVGYKNEAKMILK